MLFEREAERISGALGDRALRVEHVGSTSVPGLAAKPVIDIVLVVADSADEDAMLAFRDWLRAHDHDRDLYLNAKRELAAREWRHVQNYADAKSEAVQKINARAQQA